MNVHLREYLAVRGDVWPDERAIPRCASDDDLLRLRESLPVLPESYLDFLASYNGDTNETSTYSHRLGYSPQLKYHRNSMPKSGSMKQHMAAIRLLATTNVNRLMQSSWIYLGDNIGSPLLNRLANGSSSTWTLAQEERRVRSSIRASTVTCMSVRRA